MVSLLELRVDFYRVVRFFFFCAAARRFFAYACAAFLPRAV
jgi:hypothetical protein